MSDESQIEIPQSFVAVYVEPGRIKPSATREVLAARYELCEDMANMLTEHAKSTLFELGVTEGDVLGRFLQGLRTDDSVVTIKESAWVIRRLAELLDWPPVESTEAS